MDQLRESHPEGISWLSGLGLGFRVSGLGFRVRNVSYTYFWPQSLVKEYWALSAGPGADCSAQRSAGWAPKIDAELVLSIR